MSIASISGHPVPQQAIHSLQPSQSPEAGETGPDRDGDSDDSLGAAAVSASAQPNLMGQLTGQHINVTA